MPIAVRVEGKRGCGFRKPGGLYLISDGPGRSCGRLPLELTVCPCCGAGIKPSRGWTWVDADALLENSVCLAKDCDTCPLSQTEIGHAGLLWIGGEFYKTTRDFDGEAERMGISRRIAAVPNDFVLGQTWVLLAHRAAITKEIGGTFTAVAAIFRMFCPQRIEYVVTGKETPEEIAALEKRGITPVIVRKSEEQPEML